ncbi:hypothetical protein PoB_002386900 [Plakobranchus ocellatus]|uniref:Uncharacterized protein n=1 Tax=Plakobranchus ocellatus TaxID=259542 RepID=A0AAV3ZPW3_9GAST|nr:hypothetical protein PoB_002386900 [Plakobranchus ocellatus]
MLHIRKSKCPRAVISPLALTSGDIRFPNLFSEYFAGAYWINAKKCRAQDMLKLPCPSTIYILLSRDPKLSPHMLNFHNRISSPTIRRHLIHDARPG